MYRRKFITDVFKVVALGNLITIVPTKRLSAALSDSWSRMEYFEPYRFDLTSNFFQKRSLPSAIKSKAIEYTPGRSAWITGEGFSHLPLSDEEIRNYGSCGSRGYTPVSLLTGAQHQVYGQFLNAVIGQVGIIRGFDDEFHCVHPSFKNVFTQKYQCYGLPKNSYVIKRCSHPNCGEDYVYQDFYNAANCGKETTRFYSWIENCKGTGGNHDYVTIRRADPCGIDDNLMVETD